LRQKQTRIFVLNIGRRGANARQLRGAQHRNDTDPAWNPRGTQLVFASGIGRGRADIFTMRSNGSSRRRLTRTPKCDEAAPSWSVAGIIAFERDCGGGPSVIALRADGKRPRLLAARGGAPAWSPNGEKLAYVTPEALHIRSIATKTEVLVPAPISPAGRPTWASDGRSVIFTAITVSGCLPTEQVDQLYVVDAQGGAPNPVFASQPCSSDFQASARP
jgi:Tol biopolymer transport system component